LKIKLKNLFKLMKYLFYLIILFFIFSCQDKKKSNSTLRTISEISKELIENPNDTVLLKLRKQLFLQKNNFEAAIIDHKKIISFDSTNIDLLFELANMQYQVALEGKNEYYKKSLNTLSKNEFLNKNHFSSLLLRSELNYIFGNYKESLSDINKVLKIDPYLAKAYFYKALNFKDLGLIEKAISNFQTTIEQDPKFIKAYEQLGFLYSELNNSLAELYFNNAVLLDSSNIKMLYNKGKYLQDVGKFKEAEKCYKSILKIDAFNEFANYNLGYLKYIKSDYELAADYFSDALYTNPKYSNAFFSRGMCFKKLKRYHEASKDFIKTLEIDSSFFSAKEELNLIKGKLKK
tara:strand:- start:2201 stop:3241 length:1041 start_codon:yes stop_codon:yes gene_type:complete